jgi:hypothetical protein
VDAEVFVVSKEERADVEAGVGSGGHPVLVELYESLKGFHEHFLGELGQAEPVCGFDFDCFNCGDFTEAFSRRAEAESISAVLYPNDSFDGGRLLEPSCGIGNFIGMIPGDNTKVTGVELDSLTGRIAQKLYPQAQIQVCGFENSKLKENSFDVAVGNVPFGDIHLYDKKYNPHNLLIHDYFFSKSLDMVKPGGVVAFITSKGTLDKSDPTARRLLAEKAEFLGAVRLPNNAFKANAGTEVTSDIIFLQKRTEPLTITAENEPLWIKTAKDSNGIEMNAYFATHPDQICGTMTMVSGPYGMESTCEPNRDIKLSEQLKAALSNIQGKIETRTTSQNEKVGLELPVAAPESLRNCSYFLSFISNYCT